MNETTDTTEATGPAGPPPQPPPAYRRPALRRSVTDRKIAGVAGGLGRYFGIDPLIFRVVLLTLAIFGGSGLLLYGVGWLLVPEEGSDESEVARLLNGRATLKIIGGALLAVVGLIAVGNFAHTGFGFGGFAALVALVIAAYLISRNDNDQPLVAPRKAAPPQQPPTYYGPPAPGAYGQTTGTAYTDTPPPAPSFAPPTWTPPPAPTWTPPPAPTWTPPPPRPRSPLGRVTVSLALVAAGALVAWNLATTHDVPAEVVFAVCLAVVGLGLVVGAFLGRARGLIVVGAVLVVATSIAAISHVGVRGGVGDRTWAPHTVAGVHDVYRLGIGESTLDLSQVPFAPGDTVDIRVRQGVGDMTILLPDGVPADVDMDVNAGAVRLPNGAERHGTSVHRRYVDPRGTTSPVITIDAELGVGSMEVRRATP